MKFIAVAILIASTSGVTINNDDGKEKKVEEPEGVHYLLPNAY